MYLIYHVYVLGWLYRAGLGCLASLGCAMSNLQAGLDCAVLGCAGLAVKRIWLPARAGLQVLSKHVAGQTRCAGRAGKHDSVP